MFKVIWDKDQHKQLSNTIKENKTFQILEDTDGLKKGQIGIICHTDDMQQLKPILDQLEFEKTLMLFPTHDGWVQILIHKIMFIESFKEDIEMHMVDQHVEIIKQPLYQLEKILKQYQFIRIAKSYIVNLRKIRYIRVTFNAKLACELTNGQIVYVTRSYVKKFKDAIGIK
jgi:DNA-binding LytR/AlgR family response regulator